MKYGLYLVTVVDLFNREVVDWLVNSTMTRSLVIDAFNAAIFKENPMEGYNMLPMIIKIYYEKMAVDKA